MLIPANDGVVGVSLAAGLVLPSSSHPVSPSSHPIELVFCASEGGVEVDDAAILFTGIAVAVAVGRLRCGFGVGLAFDAAGVLGVVAFFGAGAKIERFGITAGGGDGEVLLGSEGSSMSSQASGSNFDSICGAPGAAENSPIN